MEKIINLNFSTLIVGTDDKPIKIVYENEVVEEFTYDDLARLIDNVKEYNDKDYMIYTDTEE